MFIVSNEMDCSVNTDYVIDIFIKNEDIIAQIAGSHAKSTVIVARYDNSAEALRAFKFLMLRIPQSDKILYMPKAEQLPNIIEQSHHIKGKKTKGHGGS